ncbi:MAG TPA: LemA family protein [Bdellovibrionota bacterium]|jgi:LemA protein|nr:LemA family protein [Bdellovibrionota bacterium]
MAPVWLVLTVAACLLCLALGAWCVTVYNGLISLKNQVERAWANIDVLLKQRFDEIPQLIQVLQQFVGYEQSTIKKLVDARKSYGAAASVEEKVRAAGDLSLALKGVVAIGEGYPELKSSNQFSQLQTRISALEDALSDRRETYNECVVNLNTRIEQFPDVFFAGMLGYARLPVFEVSAPEREKPSVNLRLAG